MGSASRIAATAALGLSALALHAQEVTNPSSGVHVAGMPLGSGVPVIAGVPSPSVADHVAGGDYHVPNYLPGHPTAATLWPRVVYVPCKRDEARGELLCGGYDVSPVRGEYIYLRPLVEATPPPREVPPPPPKPIPRPAPPVRKKPMG
jgi:hypothetical protein